MQKGKQLDNTLMQAGSESTEHFGIKVMAASAVNVSGSVVRNELPRKSNMSFWTASTPFVPPNENRFRENRKDDTLICVEWHFIYCEASCGLKTIFIIVSALYSSSSSAVCIWYGTAAQCIWMPSAVSAQLQPNIPVRALPTSSASNFSECWIAATP